MTTVCPGCRQAINEHSAVMLAGGLVYHQRCAPLGRPSAPPPRQELLPKVAAVLVLGAPFLFAVVALFLFFPIPMLLLALLSPFVLAWYLAARKIRDRYGR